MGFNDEDGLPLINAEHKVRIALSERARMIMAEDMDVFHIKKPTTFINTVFRNYRGEAKSSINNYLDKKKEDLDRLFTEKHFNDKKIMSTVIDLLIQTQRQQLLDEIMTNYNSSESNSRIYHIDIENYNYLIKDCLENEYYKRPGLYIRSVIEEYCSLPFIERERIYKKEIYDIVTSACKNHTILKIKTEYNGKPQLFYVYPYKIVADPFHTQSYLVCYSRKPEESIKDKILASFSMARLTKPTVLKEFIPHPKDSKKIENILAKHSAAYLVGKSEQIEIKLTPKGKKSYQSRLYSRPEIQSITSNGNYIFNCTPQQIFNYFFSFGPEAEIIRPKDLRTRFQNTYKNALTLYE